MLKKCYNPGSANAKIQQTHQIQSNSQQEAQLSLGKADHTTFVQSPASNFQWSIATYALSRTV